MPISWSPGVSALDALNDSTWQRHLADKIVILSHCFKFIVYKTNKKYYEISTKYRCVMCLIHSLVH